MLTSLKEFQERDSGWALSRILNLIINVNKLNPMRAGCHIKISRKIAMKMSSNQCAYDGQCILRVISGRCFEKHPAEKYTERESSYPHYTAVLNLADIEFSMTLKDISKFERLNAMSMYTASKMDRFFFCGSPMTRKRSTSTYCTCKIHATTASVTLRGSRSCRVS